MCRGPCHCSTVVSTDTVGRNAGKALLQPSGEEMTHCLLNLLRSYPVRGVRILHDSLSMSGLAFAGMFGSVVLSVAFARVEQLLFSLLLGYSFSSPLAREQAFLRTSFRLLCWHFTGCDIFSSKSGTYELKKQTQGNSS